MDSVITEQLHLLLCHLTLRSFSNQRTVLIYVLVIRFPEKDSLLLRNAELSQKCESLKRAAEEDRRDLERDLNGKSAAIAGLEQSIHELQSQVSEHQSKVRNSYYRPHTECEGR